MELPKALVLCAVLLGAKAAESVEEGGDVLYTAPSPLLRGHDLEFSYEGANGPANWPRLFPMCGGLRQSPINILTNSTKSATYPPLRIKNPSSSRWGTNLTNNGHTAMVQLNPAPPIPFVLQGGPLNGPYDFQQLHFHWRNLDAGSEHAFNSRFAAMEMHVVFTKREYGDSADKYSDGIAVLAVLFDRSVLSNPALIPIMASLPHVTTAGSVTPLGSRLDVRSLLPDDCRAYYTYQGSLTTPPCDEAVIWIVFKQRLPVSSWQVAAFRKLRTGEGRQLVSNRRPLQPLGDRTVHWVRGKGPTPRSCF